MQSLPQCGHPTQWHFIVSPRSYCSKQKSAFQQGVTGVQQSSGKSYRILHVHDRVTKALSADEQTSILTWGVVLKRKCVDAIRSERTPDSRKVANVYIYIYITDH